MVLGRLGCGTASAKLLLPVGPCTLHWGLIRTWSLPMSSTTWWAYR
jgi:hypothetical protein